MQNHFLELLSTSGFQLIQTFSHSLIAESLQAWIYFQAFASPFWFGDTFPSARENILQELLSGSSSSETTPQRSSCRSDLPRKKHCKAFASQSRAKKGPITTRTTSCHALQNICSHEHSLKQSRAPVPAWCCLLSKLPPRAVLSVLPHRSHLTTRQKTDPASPTCGVLIIAMHQEELLLQPDTRLCFRGGHRRSVSYRFICKHEKTSSGVNKNMESHGAFLQGEQ